MKEVTKFRLGAWLIFAAALAAVLCLGVSVANGQDSIGLKNTERYVWHGFELYDKSYFHTGAAANIRGFDIAAISHADDLEADDFEYWDAAVSYSELPKILGLNLSAGYNYLVLPTMDAQEISGTISMPGTVSPRYTISHIIPDNSNNGQVHVLGLDYPIGDMSDPNAVTAVLSADVTYNDGVNPFGQTVIRDFTHASAGLIVNLPVHNMVIQPGVIWQHTFNDALDVLTGDKNEVWYTIGVYYRY